ncbi:integral membrane protein 2B [Onthophagus taurus]|uniref:integral membrane protein 2B n=1 Tax=Onthophagus taurus TaxID=166361 RepID=UPI0039BE640E
MTIVTKPITEKKLEKSTLPLVENDQLATAPPPTSNQDDLESGSHDLQFVFLRARAQKVSSSAVLCVFLTGLMVVSLGIICGFYLYKQRIEVFKKWCKIPLEPHTAMLNSDDLRMPYNSLTEELELDVLRGEYEKITVPDFEDGRNGRFVHDFNNNKTGIIDTTGQRCFVMPLDRDSVLPPKSLFDLIHKMWDGYYKVDTEIIRNTMKVIVPPLEDPRDAGDYIAKECYNLPIYKLEKYVGGVVKRSAELHTQAKFAQFSGKGITEFDLVNFDDVLAYEESQKNH